MDLPKQIKASYAWQHENIILALLVTHAFIVEQNKEKKM